MKNPYNLTDDQVNEIVLHWYTMGNFPDILQDEDGRDLEEILEPMVYYDGKEEPKRPVVVNQYTQGEWSIDPKASLRITNGKTTICSIPYGNSQSLEEEQANTRLIANAPKLHQFAEAFFDMLNRSYKNSMYLPMLEKVLNDINPKD